MKKLATLMILSAAMVGCMPTRPEPAVKPAEAEKATSAEKVAARLPLVLPETINQHNASQKAQALLDEMNREQKTSARSVAEARK